MFSEDVDEMFYGVTRTFRLVNRVIERTIDENGVAASARHRDRGLVDFSWRVRVLRQEDHRTLLDHATSEQLHSEFKSDLDIGRLPTGKFATNYLILACAVLAYNILRWIDLEGLTGRQELIRARGETPTSQDGDA